MVALGTLKQYPYGEAYATSADGSVVGGLCSFRDLYDGFVWSAAKGIREVPSSPALTANSVQGVSADGTVLAGIAGGGFTPQAFRWTAPDRLVGLGDLTSVKVSGALGLSADGATIVGQAANAKEVSVPIVWTADTGIIELALPPGTVGGAAFGISAGGAFAVGSANVAERNYLATLWNPDGAVLLGDVPGGTQACAAYAVCADGSRVVGFGTTGAGQEAFLWTAAGGIQPLRDVLVGAGLSWQLEGWALSSATGISDDGRTIVGYGIDPAGNVEAFLAVLP